MSEQMIEAQGQNLDEILMRFSVFGRYHLQTLALVYWGYVTNSVYASYYIFVTDEATSRYRCKNESYSNQCSSSRNSSDRCAEWIYDEPDSFVAEFQLACQDWKRTLVGTIHGIGYMMGLLLVGPLSDRLGRKKMTVMTGVTGAILGLSRSFTSYYWMYIVLAFMESAIGDIFSPLFTLSVEMVASKNRILFQMLCNYGCTAGSLLLPLLAWLFPYWRTFHQVIYAPALLFIFYIFALDESPRWYLSKEKKKNAIEILEKMSKTNKVVIEKKVLRNISYEAETELKFIDLLKNTLKSPTLLKRFFICLSWWTASTFVNYGLAINSVSLPGNKYVNYALINIVDIPGGLLVSYIMIKFQRKYPLMLSFGCAAVLCFIQAFIPADLPWLSTLLYMAGKFMSSAYFSITYMYTTELFPTYTRNSMHALCSSLGRIGSIIAPQTPLLIKYWSGLPSVVFAAVSLLAGLATIFVPDNADYALPDTVRQAEQLT